MKKLFMVLAATIICGATLFSSCTNEDNPTDPAANLSEMIIGKWIVADINGQVAPTNEIWIISILSPTKALLSASLNERPEIGTFWFEKEDVDISIIGNKMTLTMKPDEHTTLVEEYDITSINDIEMNANLKMTTSFDGKQSLSTSMPVRLVKQTADYTAEILGLWECTGLTGIETYNDANARLEFLADGTYRYYRKNEGGEWEAVTTREFQDYFVDGTLLATRWKNQGDQELREWWEIASLADGQMTWTALRQNADGSTIQQGMTWKKIDLNIPEKIIGTWITGDVNGQPALTDKKRVVTFVSATKAYYSSSRTTRPEVEATWNNKVEANVAIDGNKVTLTMQTDEQTTSVEEYIISNINDNYLTANHKVTIMVDGNVTHTAEAVLCLTKTTADYAEPILGLWECTGLTGIETYNDANARLEFLADGTYLYYRVDDGGQWQTVTTREFQDYFVDGTLLATRWKNIDEDELREWWEIAYIKGDKMQWKALRANEDGTTFEQTMDWEKVE